MSSDENVKTTRESRDERLDRVRTAGAISISPELFEQLYLSPKNNVNGQLRRTFGNPTPLGKITTWPMLYSSLFYLRC